MEDEASQNPTRPSRRLCNAAIGRAHRQAMQGGGDRPELPSFRSVRADIERRRRSALPPLPQEVEDVEIMEPWDSTWNNERFLQGADNDWGYAIFATDKCIQTLRTCRTVYIDGTFKTCPRSYTQVLTILGDVHGHVVPLVHALMDITHYVCVCVCGGGGEGGGRAKKKKSVRFSVFVSSIVSVGGIVFLYLYDLLKICF